MTKRKKKIPTHVDVIDYMEVAGNARALTMLRDITQRDYRVNGKAFHAFMGVLEEMAHDGCITLRFDEGERWCRIN